MTAELDIIELGGLAATHELYARGHTRNSLAIDVADGHIIRVRQGWYLLPSTAESSVRAARVGGRLGCLSAARHYGLSVRGNDDVHVSLPPHTSRLRSPTDRRRRLAGLEDTGIVAHWTDDGNGGSRYATDPLKSVLQMALCVSPERTVAAIDSAIRLRLVTLDNWTRAIAGLPRRLRRLLARANGASESITESITRFRLNMLGIEPRLQVRISGVGRVDMVIGDRLVLEIDGYAYHSDKERFEADRRRDARLSARGYRVLRFSYDQIFNHWSEVKSAILAAIARGDHLASS